MMELSHSLTLNEEALAQINEAKRPLFVLEWLRFLDKILAASQKSDIKGCQKTLVEQLIKQVHQSPGPPARKLIGRCLATLFSIGDTSLLFDTINKFTDILKNRDDSPSFLQIKLTAVTCIGAMYEQLGRMMGRSYDETVSILLKSLKNAESQARCEIMLTTEKIVGGMGAAASHLHKDIFKAVRHCLTDRVMAVRCAGAKCLQEMLKHSPFLYTTDLETVASLCFRSFESSNYEVRCAVAKLLGSLIAITQQASQAAVGKNRLASLDEVLALMSAGFLRGGIGFLKSGAGEMIKGNSTVSRDIRVGVTHAYVVLLQQLGSCWLENNLNVVLTHLLELVSSPRAATTHVDAVYSRKCVTFILHSVLGKLLGEKAQIAACKELIQIIIKHSKEDSVADLSGNKDNQGETALSQHVIVCALQELGSLLQTLNTMSSQVISDPSAGIEETVVSVLLHSSLAVRLAAAWCLRCLSIAVPSKLMPLLDRCMDRSDTLKTSPEAISGYTAAIASLLGAARHTPLGIPHNRGKMVFNVAEDLLRCASQNSRLSLQRTQAGWLLIGAVLTLGPSVVRGLLPRLLLIWKNSFPRSAKELESEKVRGDAFTWQLTLEGRAGALSAMASFLLHCKELVTEEVIRRLLTPVESALIMLTSLGHIFKSYGQHLKASAAMVRMRLYEVLTLLPPKSYESSYNNLLRLLVAEFTLTENPANTTTSLLRGLCHSNDSIILGFWLQETDHKVIEDQLQPNSASGSGALEHDSTALYKSLKSEKIVPGPLPLGVAVIDMSVILYGVIFPHVAFKHRLQMLEHFSECVRHTKATRQEAVQINIFTAVLNALRALVEAKARLGPDEVKKAAVHLILSCLNHVNAILRCAAGEALGRVVQSVGDSRFVAEMAQHSFDKLKSARDAASRTGHSLALGCMHRYVGNMGSGQHLNTSVSILLALAQDTNAPIVQVWALHALAMIADSGGPMFRAYVEPTLSLFLKLLLNMTPTHIDVHQCIGKCLSALITTVGPELQGNTTSICTTRSSFLIACAIMQDHGDPLVQAEAISCLQQLHMFAPRHVNLSTLVPKLCAALNSSHLLLRRAAVACLRQLAQREAREICDHTLLWAKEVGPKDNSLPFAESGLDGILFAMLDTETDFQLVKDIHDTLTSILQAMAEDSLGHWLSLCKDVLTAAESSSAASTSPDHKELDADVPESELDIDDEESFKTAEETNRPGVAPRWPTRVFAAESLQRIIIGCENNNAHFDLAAARERKMIKPSEDFLVHHLSDLVRMAFMAATSESDPLRLEGLKVLELIIDKFSKVPEPEFPGHVILEQYQAQVGAALRPAFSSETPSHITAVACQVCSAWIGSGVARDLNDLRRVHQLMVSSLTKLNKGNGSQIYNESASTLEKLAILKAWAEVYVVAMDQEKQKHLNHNVDQDAHSQESLLRLVSPELLSLSKYWLAALKDHGLLSLPPEFCSQLPHDGGAFYTSDTMESVRRYYKEAWPPILHAAVLWLCHGGFVDETKSANENSLQQKNEEKFSDNITSDNFHLLLGICMEALCSPHSTAPLECILICLQSLQLLLNNKTPRTIIGEDRQLSIELCNVLHRLLLTRESPECQLLVMDLARLIVIAHHESYEAEKKKYLRELAPANQEPKDVDKELASLGEGGESGIIIPEKSVVFALLEDCLCLLVRHLPQLSPSLATTTTTTNTHCPLVEEAQQLISASLDVLVQLPGLCSPLGSISVLSVVLYLITGVLKETAVSSTQQSSSTNIIVTSAIQCLRILAASPFTKNSICKDEWISILQSTLSCILDFGKTSVPNKQPDQVSILLAVAVFILSAPSEVISIPNLQYPCINLFKQALQQNGENIQLKCLQTLKSIFQHPNGKPYIHALAPRIVELLGQNASQVIMRQPLSDIKVSIILESFQALEILVSVAPTDKKIHMLELYVPILITVLMEPDNQNQQYSSHRMLHDYSLQQLLKVGPQYPQEFRLIISKNAHLKTRLEASIRAGQLGTSTTEENIQTPPRITATSPSIKLKTDFSNFTG